MKERKWMNQILVETLVLLYLKSCVTFYVLRRVVVATDFFPVLRSLSSLFSHRISWRRSLWVRLEWEILHLSFLSVFPFVWCFISCLITFVNHLFEDMLHCLFYNNWHWYAHHVVMKQHGEYCTTKNIIIFPFNWHDGSFRRHHFSFGCCLF